MGLRGKLCQVWSALQEPHIRSCALFIFMWQSTPNPSTALFYWQTSVLGFSPGFMQLVYLCGTLSGFAGLLVYNLALVRVNIRTLLLCCALLGFALNALLLLQVSRVSVRLGIDDKLFALCDYSILYAIAEVMMTPMLALAARNCPVGVEATLYATLYSILYGSKTLAAGLGSLLTAWYGVTEDQFGNMFKLVLTCNLLMLLPLPLLLFIPTGVPHTMPPSPQASIGPSTLATAPDGESGGIAQEHNPQSQSCGLLRSGPGAEPGGCSQHTQPEETKLPPAATLECQVSQLAMWHPQTYTAILAELPGTC